MEDQNKNDKAQVLIDLSNVTAFRLINKNRYTFCQGNLKIGYLNNQNISFLNIQEFYFTLEKQIKVLKLDFKSHITILLPHIEEGFIALAIPRTNDEDQNKLLDIFIHTTTLYTKQLFISDEVFSQAIKTHAADVLTVPLVDDSTVISYINKGGFLLKEGFGWLGSIVASGVNKGGEFVSNKMEKKEEQQVSQETKQKFENAKSKSTQYMTVTGTYLSAILNPIIKKSKTFIEQKNQEIDQGNNQTLKTVKGVAKATGNAFNDAFSGIKQGAKEVGNSFVSTSRQIVQKRYGDDYSKTFLGEQQQQQGQQQCFQQQQPQQQQPQISQQQYQYPQEYPQQNPPLINPIQEYQQQEKKHNTYTQGVDQNKDK